MMSRHSLEVVGVPGMDLRQLHWKHVECGFQLLGKDREAGFICELPNPRQGETEKLASQLLNPSYSV
jgi:hypothetical protein